MPTLYLTGFIRDATYTPHLIPNQFSEYNISQFDVNQAQAYGLINLGVSGNNLVFSKWVTPKRTRSYPFARIYNTFHLNTKKATIIPIIKDEGAGTQNNDRINFITFSWMNLLNIYIGNLFLPCEADDIFGFCAENRLSQVHQKRIFLLNQEARENNKLQIWITGRHG